MTISMFNALTIDVEDYWSIFFRDWLHIEAEPSDAVVKNTKWFLQTLGEFNIKATFFVLGEVAEKFPELVKEIACKGHEVGVHGFYHKKIFELDSDTFKKEVGSAKKLLEDITGQKVLGHRAPAFSFNADTQWALEVLAECGFKYDSSISPAQGSRLGWPGFKKEIHRANLPSGKSILEVPMSAVSLGIVELRVGGGYMRHFPYLYTKLAVKTIQRKRPVVLYVHPYEIDVQELALNTDNLTRKQRKRALQFHKMQLRNRNTVGWKFTKLLNEFKFTSIREVINSTAENEASL
ncbi:MAG: polysaccharide deacetylase family protein [Sedimentisphaerales bacterium]|nr:polysaccharide deacetylase family protein [Sedimentisphaerales bacterium]